ncbi:thiamine pyrophosphate-dependent enzyme [Chloroflexota bacterium]
MTSTKKQYNIVLNGGDILLDVLKSYGVECIFCSPGTEWVSVWESLARRYSQGDETLKYFNCRHEALAVALALGYTDATGRLSAVLLHGVVGPLNGALPIRAAYRTQAPMIIFTGDSSGFGEDEDDRGEGCRYIGGLSDKGGNAIPVSTYVKWSNSVTSKETLLNTIYRACGIAQAPPQGPVFISIPFETLLKSQPQVRIPPASPAAGLPEPRPDDLEKVADYLLESKRPIVLTEYAGNEPEAIASLVELAELLSIPVFEGGIPRVANFPKEHPLYGGCEVTEALLEADAVFIVGATLPWQPCSAFPKDGTKVILVDEDPFKQQLPYWGYRPDLSVTADVSQWLAALVVKIRERLNGSKQPAARYRERFQRWQTKHKQMMESWKAEAQAGRKNKPISPEWFLSTISKLLPEDSIILEESTSHRSLIHRYLSRPGAYFNVRNGLGIGLGVAAGTKLAYPDKPVIFLVGDGAFNYNPVLAGLGFCQEYHLPILTIVMNNGIYAAMKTPYRDHFPGGWSIRSNKYLSVDIAPRPDYVKIAEAFDAYGERVETPGDIKPALNRALKQIAMGRAALIDLIVE